MGKGGIILMTIGGIGIAILLQFEIGIASNGASDGWWAGSATLFIILLFPLSVSVIIFFVGFSLHLENMVGYIAKRVKH